MEIDEVRGFIEKQGCVRVAYLFGSHAKGTEGPLSDLDIAVLLDGRLGKKEKFDLKSKLINPYTIYFPLPLSRFLYRKAAKIPFYPCLCPCICNKHQKG